MGWDSGGILVEVRILSPTAILGYGFPRESLEAGIRLEPDAIGVDAGSTDPGPYYLGEGVPLVPDRAVERDLRLLMEASRKSGAPLIIGSAGGAGSRVHVDRTLAIAGRVAERMGWKPRVAVVYTDVSVDLLASMLEEGLVAVPADPWAPSLTPERLKESVRVVAQAGVEVVERLFREGYDMIIAGRIVDVAPFAGPAWAMGVDKGLAVHMGKILECGAIAADPGSGSDSMMGIARRGEFEVFPLNPARRATRLSVAEHALYERRDPYRERVPGGYADLSNAVYEEVDGRVIVRGTRWVEVERMVKLEGARRAGYRVIVAAGARDPDFISRIDALFEEAVAEARRHLGVWFEAYLRVYGRDGVMGSREPRPQPGREVGLLIEVVAPDRQTAEAAAAQVRSRLLHAGWPGRRTTAGNLAFPLSPSDIPVGWAYEWSVWHLIPEGDPFQHATVEEVKLGA